MTGVDADGQARVAATRCGRAVTRRSSTARAYVVQRGAAAAYSPAGLAADERADRVLHGERAADPRGPRGGRLHDLRRRPRAVHLVAHRRRRDVVGLLRSAARARRRSSARRARASARRARATSGSSRSTRARTSRKRSGASAACSADSMGACGGSLLVCLSRAVAMTPGHRRCARRRRLEREAVLRQRDEPLPRR